MHFTASDKQTVTVAENNLLGYSRNFTAHNGNLFSMLSKLFCRRSKLFAHTRGETHSLIILESMYMSYGP